MNDDDSAPDSKLGAVPWESGPEPPADAFELAVERAIADVPEPFASRLGSVAVVIEDWPSRDQLESAGAHGLFGLYQGVPRTTYGADQVQWPSKITIFRGPLEQAFRDPVGLAAAIEDTVHHEIAHHFGISDERLRELRRAGQSSAQA